jgi:hypothetical protein
MVVESNAFGNFAAKIVTVMDCASDKRSFAKFCLPNGRLAHARPSLPQETNKIGARAKMRWQS